MTRTPLDLYLEVQTADGTRYKWDANQPAGSRLQNFSFGTKLGEGFSDGGGQLPRRIDLDYADLQLVQSVTAVGADGSVAYEGRLAAMPRELGDSHSIGVTLVGWMAHAKDRRFREVYVDRDLTGWGDQSATRRANLLAASRTTYGPDQYTDPTNNTAGVALGFNGAWTYPPVAEAWYDAGPGVTIGRVKITWARESATVDLADANWDWFVFVSDDDVAATYDRTAGLAAGLATVTFDPPTPRRWAGLQLAYAAAAGADGVRYGIVWSKPAVYGTHGLPLYAGEPGEPEGVYASDVIRDIANRFCPQLDTSGVQNTDYVIQHLAFKDRTLPYDAFLELNKFHLWHLAVWENRRLTFRPYDLTDYQWEIRTDDPGTTFAPVGPTTDDLFNGIEVTYTDVLTGRTETVTPDDDPELLETSTSNPWNQFGIPHWDEITLSAPTVRAQAVQIGVAALAQKNRPKTAGSLTVRGYIRDRAGNPQPVWKVRAGDVIQITNFNDINRLIVETTYDNESKTLTAAIDFPFQTLEALFDRASNAAAARGLQ